jgi:hypothetical protein
MTTKGSKKAKVALFALCVLAMLLLLFSGSGLAKSHAEEQDSIFSHENLNEYHLSIDEAKLEWLNTHELLEEFVPANLSFVDNNLPQQQQQQSLTAYQDIGIRYKGSKGSLEFCFSNATGNEGSSEWNKRLCKKLSIKLGFDTYKDSQRFYDMKKINLHAMMNDNSMMRECLAYNLYRQVGLKVPRCAHAKVFINNVYQGLYLQVEYIDSRFLKHHFDDKDGVLYKEKWPGITKNATYPEYFLEGVRNHKSTTNDKDVKPMLKFSQKIYQAETSKDVLDLLHKYWEVDTLLKTLVVATVIDDWDSFFTFFSSDPNHHSPDEPQLQHQHDQQPATRFNHNYYIFQASTGKQRLSLIQWDTDITFAETGSVLELFFGCPAWTVPLCEDEGQEELVGGGGSVAAAVTSSQYCTPCKLYMPYNASAATGQPGNGIYPGSCDKIVGTIATEMRDEFLSETWKFLENVFIPDNLEKVTEEWTTLLRDAHECDPNYPPGRELFPAPSSSSMKAGVREEVVWTEEVAKLVETIQHEYKRALERTNPVYKPHVPDKKDLQKVFKCVQECSKFLHERGIKSLYTCYNICLFEVPLASSQSIGRSPVSVL